MANKVNHELLQLLLKEDKTYFENVIRVYDDLYQRPKIVQRIKAREMFFSVVLIFIFAILFIFILTVNQWFLAFLLFSIVFCYRFIFRDIILGKIIPDLELSDLAKYEPGEIQRKEIFKLDSLAKQCRRFFNTDTGYLFDGERYYRIPNKIRILKYMMLLMIIFIFIGQIYIMRALPTESDYRMLVISLPYLVIIGFPILFQFICMKMINFDTLEIFD